MSELVKTNKQTFWCECDAEEIQNKAMKRTEANRPVGQDETYLVTSSSNLNARKRDPE